MPHVDLDAFLAEQEAADLPSFTLDGKTYTAPPEISWVAVEKAQELHGMEMNNADAKKLCKQVIQLVYGEEAWKAMERRKLGPTSALKLVNQAMDYMQSVMPEVDPKLLEMAEAARGEGETPSPSPEKTSSETSRSSKRTSKGSISLAAAT